MPMRFFRRQTHQRQYVQLLLNWRWMVLFISIPISLVIEILEGTSLDLHFLDEVLLDGLVLPFSTWFVLTFVAGRIARQIDHEAALEQQQQFMQRLADHREYHDLIEFVVRYAATLVPTSNVTLLLYSQDRALEPVAEWRSPVAPNGAAQRTYRFMLIHAGAQLGFLQIQCPAPAPEIKAAINLLTSLLREIARALAQAIDDEHEAERVYRAAQAYERRRLTQELHDSLAQQVFYLHLNLDQLADDQSLPAIEQGRQKLGQMREVAADIYEQIRNNLSILRAWEQVNLTEAISELARITAHNASLHVEVDVRGVPGWLSPHTCEQIYSVVREALNNVVKHAQAQRVGLALAWEADSLQITVSDDGVGFMPDTTRPEGHYGLTLMREGVESLGGSLSVESAPGSGARLHVAVPLRASDRQLDRGRPRPRDAALV